MCSPWKFLATWHKKTSDGEKWYPTLIDETFCIAKKFWKIGRFPHEIFWYCETKYFRLNCDIPIIQKKTSIPEKFWNTKLPPTKIFGTLRHKKVRGKIVISPATSSILSSNFLSIIEVFFSTGVLTLEVFGFSPVTQKFSKNSGPDSHACKSSIPVFFETKKGSATSFFGTLRQKNSTAKSDWGVVVKLSYG